MGGALAVHTALLNVSSYNNIEGNAAVQDCSYKNGIQNLVGICVIDVVEGTAMEALSSMQSFLRSRPKSFPSLGNNRKPHKQCLNRQLCRNEQNLFDVFSFNLQNMLLSGL